MACEVVKRDAWDVKPADDFKFLVHNVPRARKSVGNEIRVLIIYKWTFIFLSIIMQISYNQKMTNGN